MGLFQAISRRIVAAAGFRAPSRQFPRITRGFDAAQSDRRTGNWSTLNESSNRELRYGLRALRARSRALVNNNEYAARFLDLCSQNIVGPEGFKLEPRGRSADGQADDANNDQIEEAWRDWGRKGICTVDGALTWEDAQHVIVECVARDGEVLIRPVVGTAAGNDFGFAIQILEADYLDDQYYQTNDSSGAGVFMGVEVDKVGRVVAYYILSYNPSDYGYAGNAGRARVPAADLMHIFTPRRGQQRRGVPWMTASMLSLYQLGDFKESELTATRVAAGKMAFFKSSGEGAAPMGADDEDTNEAPIMEVEPGTFERLPFGWDVTPVDWRHPNVAFDQFVKSCLRGSAVGVGVGYNELAGDLENVNYSSLREGRLSTVDLWRKRQRWYRDWVCQPIYERWLDMAIVTGAVTLPARKAQAFRYPKWVARGWDWVDPEKESTSNRVDLALGLTTRTRILAKKGEDFDDVIEELAGEAKAMIALGLNPDVPLPGKSAAPGVETGAPTDEPVPGSAPATPPKAAPAKNGAAGTAKPK